MNLRHAQSLSRFPLITWHALYHSRDASMIKPLKGTFLNDADKSGWLFGYSLLSRNQSAHTAFQKSCQNKLVSSNILMQVS